MTSRVPRLRTLAVLTLIWCALWGEVTAANLISGAAVALGITALGVGSPGPGAIRPVALLRLVWVVVVDLVTSTVDVAGAIVASGDTRESVVAVSLPPAVRAHALLLTVAVTLTPGTAVVDTDLERGILYLHLLRDERREVTVAHVDRLADLALQAFPPTGKARS